MPRALSADHDLWGRTLSLLLIGFICYALPLSVFATALPASEDNQPLLRIEGSNTIGATNLIKPHLCRVLTVL